MAGQLDEVGALQRALREQDAVVGQDGDRVAPDPGEAADQGLAVEGLELVEGRAVDDAGDDLAHVVGGPDILRDDAVKLLGVEQGRPGFSQDRALGPAGVQAGDDPADDGQGVGVVLGHVVDDARPPAMHVGAAKVGGRDDLARRGLHQGRPAKEDGALALLPGSPHDHRLVGHGRDVGPARRARAHDAGDLGDPPGAHPGLVEEDPAEMVPVREDLGLVGQVGAAGIHQVDAGQGVLLGDLLGPQVLLHRQGEIGPALHRGVVGQDHDLAAADPADASDQAGGGRLVVVEAEGRQGADLQEGSAGVQQPLDTVARQELAPGQMAPAAVLRPAEGGDGGPLPQPVDEGAVDLRIGAEGRRGRVEGALQDGHGKGIAGGRAGG